MLAHQGGSETTHTGRHNAQRNLNHIPTWQTLPGSQSEQRSLAKRQGSLWTTTNGLSWERIAHRFCCDMGGPARLRRKRVCRYGTPPARFSPSGQAACAPVTVLSGLPRAPFTHRAKRPGPITCRYGETPRPTSGTTPACHRAGPSAPHL